jgi:hypothetical protein
MMADMMLRPTHILLADIQNSPSNFGCISSSSMTEGKEKDST